MVTTQQSAAAKFSLDSAGHLISNNSAAYANVESLAAIGWVAENVVFRSSDDIIELNCAIAAGSLNWGGNQWGAGGTGQVELQNGYIEEVFTFSVIACT